MGFQNFDSAFSMNGNYYMVEMYSQRDKTDTELQYELVAVSPGFKFLLCHVNHDTWKKFFHFSVPSFSISKIEMPVIIKTLPRLVENIKRIDISQHLQWHVTHNKHCVNDGD